MPVTKTYPGLYIEEQPLSAHTISAAPTSIAVMVGYTHPFKTTNFGKAVRLFSFTEYEREFGGMFASGLIESHLPQAVNQFFLNGGSDLYVVGLAPKVKVPAAGGGDAEISEYEVPRRSFPTNDAKKIVFKGLEPTDKVKMTVKLSNLRKSGASDRFDTFDVSVSYGRRVETYRSMTLATLRQINGASALVSVDDGNGEADFGAGFAAGDMQQADLSAPAATTTASFDPQDFVAAFKTDGSLDKVPVFNLLMTPGIFDLTVNSAALVFAERKLAFVILDPPIDSAADSSDADVSPVDEVIARAPPVSENGAIYFPYLRTIDPILNTEIEVAPSGYVAGIFARTDARRGVWKAPAGLETNIANTSGVVARGDMTNQRQGVLYQGVDATPINCLRSFPGAGTVVFGARTLVASNDAYNQSKYVPVRRMTLFIEQTLLANLGWVVFEPNDMPLWIAIRMSIENFLLSLYNQGALQGDKPSDAFEVKCDHDTTTQTDIDLGIVNIHVSFRPLKPAEFVVIKIAQLAGQAQA